MYKYVVSIKGLTERVEEVHQTKKLGPKAMFLFPAVTFVFETDIDFMCPLNHSKDFMQTIMYYQDIFITSKLL